MYNDMNTCNLTSLIITGKALF